MAKVPKSWFSLLLDSVLPMARAKPAMHPTNGNRMSRIVLQSFGAMWSRFFARPMTCTGKDAWYLRPAPMASSPSTSLGATVSSPPTARKTSSSVVIVRP